MRVKVEAFKGRLRLRWSHGGQRFALSLGLPDGEVNRAVANAKALLIEGDLATGNFDPTLKKYRPLKRTAKPSVTVLGLLNQYVEFKSRKVEKGTLGKLKGLREPVADFFGSKPATAIDDDLADCFRVYLSEKRKLRPATIKGKLGELSACWKWGMKKGILSSNPWIEPIRLVKAPPTQKPKPFSQAEIAAILTAFRTSKYYCHYADFVEFRFGCGCRIEEAIGLQWKHLSDDCSAVWIGEAVTRGKRRKTTKTNRAREFKLSPRLQQVLLSRRPRGWHPEDLVFPAPNGGTINDCNFSRRAWKSILAQTGIPHRKFNSARHTFTSHALSRGLKPMAVAEIAGHDPEVLFKHYASEIEALQLPDIF